MEVARTTRVLLGILPSVRIANINRAASSVKSARFCTRGWLIVSRINDQRRVVERVL